jgi:hypothetical protein
LIGQQFSATAGGNGNANRHFKLWRPTFYRALGIELENGKQYEISGRIGGVCEFTIHHIRSEKPYVFLTIPKRDAKAVKLGRAYLISIDSVEERRN